MCWHAPTRLLVQDCFFLDVILHLKFSNGKNNLFEMYIVAEKKPLKGGVLTQNNKGKKSDYCKINPSFCL